MKGIKIEMVNTIESCLRVLRENDYISQTDYKNVLSVLDNCIKIIELKNKCGLKDFEK
jgi:hypothetical protein